MQDLRFGLRMLRKHKGFTVVTALMLALGIGATTAAFSVVDAWLLRPLPFKEPDRLIAVWEAETKSPQVPAVFAAYRHYQEWSRQVQSLESVAGYFWRAFTLMENDNVVSLMGQAVTANYFATLGIAPLHGRTFRVEDMHRVRQGSLPGSQGTAAARGSGAGSPLCVSADRQVSGVCRDSRPHRRSWNRRNHRDLQCCEYCPAQATTL